MTREIGSEFWDVPVSVTKNCLFPYETKWFISGTAALEQILDDILVTGNVKYAGIPSWCCSCMITPFLKRNIGVVFYPVWMNSDETLIADYRSTEDCDVTLCLYYFGYSSLETIGNPGGMIIEDLTHSLFCENIRREADYYFGSLRKWAGFYTGGYAWKRGEWNVLIPQANIDMNYVRVRKEAMEQKKKYISGDSNSKDYLALFEKGEDYLDTCAILPGYEKDTVKAEYLDISMIRERRRANAKILLDSCREYAIFEDLGSEDCPLFVPLLFPNEIRDGLRAYLISKAIYCPIHWPMTEFHVLDSKTEQLYRQEISLVCDQRYNESDMYRIVDEMKNYLSRRA